MRPVEPGRDYAVDFFRPEDGSGVARLFYTIYGEDYPVADYYFPDRIIKANESGDVRTVVARLDTGEVVGQTALYRGSPPNPGLFEFGQMLILPEYRHSFLALRLMLFVKDRLAGSEGVDGIFGEAVCHHLVTQKMSPKMRTSPCGLEIALMPEGAYAKERAAGRVSCLIAARVDCDRRRELFLPGCYRDAMEFVLEDLSLDREVVFATDAAPASGETSMDTKLFDFAGVLRCQVNEAGEDFRDKLEAIERRAAESKLAVVQFFLDAARSGAVYGAGVLREKGYFLGGLVPIWFARGDALLMQKLHVAPEFEAIRLFGERAQALMGHIRADYEQAAARSS
jgi:hypothetical protein